MSRLGYSRYGAQGGDWGAQVSTRIGLLDSEHCAGLHLNMPIGVQPKEIGPLTEDEQADLAAMRQFVKEESGYANEQGTKPQTVGAALNDTPAGLLGWIVEKFRAWSDCDGDPENCFTRDQLLTNVMVYWVTETIASSARLYWESRHGAQASGALPFVDVPTGVARYPKEVLRWPRSWVEGQYRDRALGGDGQRRPLRRHGAARPLRRRRPALLPRDPLTRSLAFRRGPGASRVGGRGRAGPRLAGSGHR